MSATDQTTNQAVEKIDRAVELHPEPTLTFDLGLSEAEALRAWLLKPAGDGTTSLDDPLVSPVLARLGRSVDAVRATRNVRHEFEQAGLGVDHLSDEQVRELGRRVTEAALPAIRD
jgi:hypothetical protein